MAERANQFMQSTSELAKREQAYARASSSRFFVTTKTLNDFELTLVSRFKNHFIEPCALCLNNGRDGGVSTGPFVDKASTGKRVSRPGVDVGDDVTLSVGAGVMPSGVGAVVSISRGWEVGDCVTLLVGAGEVEGAGFLVGLVLGGSESPILPNTSKHMTPSSSSWKFWMTIFVGCTMPNA
jgi:hypothetical protein